MNKEAELYARDSQNLLPVVLTDPAHVVVILSNDIKYNSPPSSLTFHSIRFPANLCLWTHLRRWYKKMMATQSPMHTSSKAKTATSAADNACHSEDWWRLMFMAAAAATTTKRLKDDLCHRGHSLSSGFHD